MSIIIGIVTDTCALVASDGRLHSGAYYENDKRIKDSEVIQDDFDKTFVLNGGKIIGAVAGTMKFEDKIIAEHLVKLMANNTFTPETLVDVLCKGLREQFEQISSAEIAFAYRKLDLIIINSNSGEMKDMKIQARRLHPDSNNSSIEIERFEISPKVQGHAAWQIYGDDTSQREINDFLSTEIQKMTRIDEKGLRSLMYKAIRLGIKVSEKNNEGNDLNCGGKVFVKSIK
jgi:hypothetical protein